MNYYQNNYNQHSQARIKQLESDKAQLSKAIQDLNECYQEKIRFMESTISQQHERCQELLQWKQNYIDKSLFQVEKYELEIKKMIKIMDDVHQNFEKETLSYENTIKNQEQQISQLREQNQMLRQHQNEKEGKIEQIVRSYTEQIQRLKYELNELKEQVQNHEQGTAQEALRDISNNEMEREQNTMDIKQNYNLSIHKIHLSDKRLYVQ